MRKGVLLMNKKEEIIPELNNEKIESMIYEIRGVKVMLDFELARIYGYTTKTFNQQVKNNIEKFPERYRFQLSKDEIDYISRSKNLTTIMQTEGIKGGRVYLPYAFTEPGIYMLMTILKGELATKQSIILIDTFKQMKDYIIESNNLLSSNELLKVTGTTYKNEKDIEKLKNENKLIRKKLETVMDNFIDPKTYKQFVFLKGERIESDLAYQKIFSLAKHTIFVIDDYIDIKTLQLLKCVKPNIKITIFSDNKNKTMNSSFVDDFKKDTNIELVLKENKTFHDRYIVLDFGYKNEIIYHCGTSSKDSGNSGTTIDIQSDIFMYKSPIIKMLDNKELDL
ncbi:MAG: ORF6N domain-containing protein [bacterium]|nr:ORF6N domain-containing protein [bacterium]